MAKASRAAWLIFGLSLVLGSWMVFDGARKLVTGLYTGEDTLGLGPWANVVSILGVNPADMAIIFILLGTVWIVNGVIVVIGGPWRYERVIAASLLTLFYLVPGTLASAATLALALRERRRDVAGRVDGAWNGLAR